jgi:hypothetical protein
MGREKKERLVVIDRDLLRLGRKLDFIPGLVTRNPELLTRNFKL